MPKVDILNFVPYLSGSGDVPVPINALSPRIAVERVRSSCAEKGESLAAWSDAIVKNCIIPPDHPLRALLNSRKIAEGDPLWTLGAIAYGTKSPWVVIRRIEWDDGSVDLPDQMEREWTILGGATL